MVYYLNENFLKEKPYVLNKFLTHKIDDNHMLLTTGHGAWVILSKEQYDLFSRDKIEEDCYLFDVLEEKGIILTEENQEKLIKTYKERFSYLFNGIGLHIISPTLRCNQKCVYCHAKSKDLGLREYDMDEDTAKEVVDFIFQTPSDSVNIEFQGGEPLSLFSIVQYIMEYAKKKNNSESPNPYGIFAGGKNLSFTVVSNLTLMDNDILDYLVKNKVKISTSLDGPKELHDSNRPLRNGKGSYEQVIRWIEEIRKRNQFLGAIPTITKHSLNYPKEIVDEYMKNGFSQIRMRELNIAGSAIQSWNDIGYTPEEFLRFWKEYFEYVISINKRGVRFSDETSSFILKRILCKKSELNACLNSPCGIGTIQCAYTHNGDIYTCDEARSDETFKLGNVKDNSYQKVFSSSHVSAFVGLSSCLAFSCENCVWNPFCSPCLVSAFGEKRSLVPTFPTFTCKIRGKQTEELFKKLIVSEEKNILMKWLSG